MTFRAIFFVIAIFFFTGCVSFQPVVPEKIEGVTFNSIDTKGLDVTLSVRIKNPNPYAIKVKSIVLDLTAAEIHVGKVVVNDKIRIPANSVSIQKLRFATSFKNAGLASVASILALAGKKDIEISGEGEIRAGVLIIYKTFPVKFSDRVKI